MSDNSHHSTVNFECQEFLSGESTQKSGKYSMQCNILCVAVGSAA